MKTNLDSRAFASRSNHLPNNAVLTPRRDAQPHVAGAEIRRFAVNPSGQSNSLAALKERITASLEQEYAGTIARRLIRQVVNEAAALAATTSFPALLLPALAEEKARSASQWAARQQAIRHQAFTLAA